MDPISVLQRIGAGYFLEEVYEAILKTSAEVVETGKPGSVTVKLKISTQHQGDPMVIVAEEIARTSPKKDSKGAMFYAVDGDLHRDDPRQTRMPFREVFDTSTGEIRDVVVPPVSERVVG